MRKLDLGAGRTPRDGFEAVDILPGSAWLVNLASGSRWPWDDESVDELYSSHFIEHIPAELVVTRHGYQDALLWFFDEAFRVCKAGALFTLRWPAYDHVWAFQDPTHRRFIPPQTLHYLCRVGREELRVQGYNVRCNWVTRGNVVGYGENQRAHEYLAELVKEP